MSETHKNGQNYNFKKFCALLLASWWPKHHRNIQGTYIYAQTTPPPSFIPIAPFLNTFKPKKTLKTPKHGQYSHFSMFRTLLLTPWLPKPNVIMYRAPASMPKLLLPQVWFNYTISENLEISKNPRNGHFSTIHALLVLWPKPPKNVQSTCVYAHTTPPPGFIPIAPFMTTLKPQKPLKTAKMAIFNVSCSITCILVAKTQ